MRRVSKHIFELAGLAGLAVACSHQLRIDQQALPAAADLNLIGSCTDSLNRGVSACRFSAGESAHGATWTLVVPPPSTARHLIASQVTILGGSSTKVFPVTDWTVLVPLDEVMGVAYWSDKQDETPLEANVQMTYVDGAGLNHEVSFRSFAVLIVTPKGYTPMAPKSGNSAWSETCTVEYSTSGRSSVSCH